MKITVFTLFPELYTPFLSTSIIKKASEQGLFTAQVQSLLSFCAPKERIDGPTYGHGPGMLIKPTVVERAIEGYEKDHGRPLRIFFSPHGQHLTQDLLREIHGRAQNHCALFAARYEGMDARVEEEYADYVISLGDFVLMGGDVPALAFMEGILRLVPGIVGREESVEHDSFTGPFVDHPEYTAPVEWRGKIVPEVLRSGNHAAMQMWRRRAAAERTYTHHFDWFRSHAHDQSDRELMKSTIPNHYAALMHSEVLVPGPNGDGLVSSTSSVTSLDIHDIARSATTYGISGYGIITPLIDQQKIVNTLLDFWHTGAGTTYNVHRHHALNRVKLCDTLDAFIAQITEREGVAPLLIATSARDESHKNRITYRDQGMIWSQKKPVLFIFGTARGLAPELLARCDYILEPIEGFEKFNHLSVRTAAGIIFDRWLGLGR